MKRLFLPAVAVLLLVAGCGDATESGTPEDAGEPPTSEATTEPTTGPSAEPSRPDLEEPPPVVLHLVDGDLPLNAWSWCYGNGCVDGFHGNQLESVGRPSEVAFSFPEEDWEFTATFNEHGMEKKCARRISMPLESTGDGIWRIDPVGPAGTWDVDLFGQGPGGDVITTFTWDTPTEGWYPPEVTGSAAVLADHDGQLDSYGVEIGIQELAVHPDDATATVTVTSAAGREVTIDTKWDRYCWALGSLWFTASETVGRQATRLGAGPFEYVVELTLDGTRYTGRGTWPDGETEDIAPHVPLTWTPALPAYQG